MEGKPDVEISSSLALATVCSLVLESRATKLRAKNERMLAK
jgi:hypothetical protein